MIIVLHGGEPDRRRPRVRVKNSGAGGSVGSTVKDDAILLYDADRSINTDISPIPHVFAKDIAYPQYCLDEHHTPTSISEGLPVDLYGGGRWLRINKAVENVFPAGFDVLTGWSIPAGVEISFVENGWYKLKANVTAKKILSRVCKIHHDSVVVSALIKKGVGGGNMNSFLMRNKTTAKNVLGARVDLDDGTLSYSVGNNGCTVKKNPDGSFLLTMYSPWAVGNEMQLYVGMTGGEITAGDYVYIKNISCVPGQVPMPYIPAGAVQPATHATSSKGMWFEIPEQSRTAVSLAGMPFTLCVRGRLLCPITAIPDGSSIPVLSSTATGSGLLFFEKKTASDIGASSRNGTVTAHAVRASDDMDVFTLITQVSSDKTAFRAGILIGGEDTAPSWSDWVSYGGAFAVGPEKRLLLGFNAQIPIGINKIAMFDRALSDTEIASLW